jgi:Raf kinase inhibitor-like YbhB/YbcL family protein
MGHEMTRPYHRGMRRVGRTAALVACGVATAIIAGCAGPSAGPTGSGTGTAAASGDATSSPSARESEVPTMAFTLMSTSFQPGASIPTKYTCDGADVSPALSWDGAPPEAAALALLVDDPDARGFVHWIVLDITASRSGGLAEGASASPDAPAQGMNDFRRVGWGGPCPPSGTHRYRFTLYALDESLGLTGTPGADQFRAGLSGHIVGQAELVANYTRGG